MSDSSVPILLPPSPTIPLFEGRRTNPSSQSLPTPKKLKVQNRPPTIQPPILFLFWGAGAGAGGMVRQKKDIFKSSSSSSDVQFQKNKIPPLSPSSFSPKRLCSKNVCGGCGWGGGEGGKPRLEAGASCPTKPAPSSSPGNKGRTGWVPPAPAAGWLHLPLVLCAATVSPNSGSGGGREERGG